MTHCEQTWVWFCKDYGYGYNIAGRAASEKNVQISDTALFAPNDSYPWILQYFTHKNKSCSQWVIFITKLQGKSGAPQRTKFILWAAGEVFLGYMVYFKPSLLITWVSFEPGNGSWVRYQIHQDAALQYTILICCDAPNTNQLNKGRWKLFFIENDQLKERNI